MYIHQNRFINNAQRIFANSAANEVADRILPIEIQPIQGKAREFSPLKHSRVEAKCSYFLRLNQRRSAQTEKTSNRMVLEELEKELEGGAKFKPLACSTPKFMVINENEDQKTTTKILENINASTKYSKEGFNGLRRSSRTRKPPIPYWSCRSQNFKLEKEEERKKKKKPYLKKKNKTKIQRPKRTLKIDENKENLID